MLTKTVYIALNEKGQTLYNKTAGTWNDRTGKRDGSSVWTFSAKKPPEESSTMIKAKEWLENLGFKVTFALAKVYRNGTKLTPVDWAPPVVYLPAVIYEDLKQVA